MLVVMLVLLMITATATFAIHATTTDVRASGYGRTAMQTGYLGEVGLVGAMDWVDRVGPRTLVDLLERERSKAPDARVSVSHFETPLAPEQPAYRLYVEDLAVPGVAIIPPGTDGTAGVDPSVVPAGVFGERSAYQPLVLVDVYDAHVYTGVMPGYSAGGGTSFRHLRATYTARGRARLGEDASSDAQTAHESAGDARATAISGPFAM